MNINRIVQGLAVTAGAGAIGLSTLTGVASAAPAAPVSSVTSVSESATIATGDYGWRPKRHHWRHHGRNGFKHCWGEWKPRRDHHRWWNDDDDDRWDRDRDRNWDRDRWDRDRDRHHRGFKWFYTCKWRR
ncbi:hypothetical protein EDD29_0168 [Actinocorallia herbida]|uniref:Uncharacterized protein n=1 Tax=Actinocorallia herbida TaxID=58109 RepID=A0A3N1CMY2_9ACTN|nr:hypothetical protein [Actinocorallia herbida]ROO82686.1 hypothetical protein EDD29_0168 [Actinocorallia herbida]